MNGEPQGCRGEFIRPLPGWANEFAPTDGSRRERVCKVFATRLSRQTGRLNKPFRPKSNF